MSCNSRREMKACWHFGVGIGVIDAVMYFYKWCYDITKMRRAIRHLCGNKARREAGIFVMRKYLSVIHRAKYPRRAAGREIPRRVCSQHQWRWRSLYSSCTKASAVKIIWWRGAIMAKITHEASIVLACGVSAALIIRAGCENVCGCYKCLGTKIQR